MWQTSGLQPVHNFTNMQPYVVCQTKTAMFQTRAIMSEEPHWNDAHVFQTWSDEPLESAVYDTGLLGAQCKGKATLTGDSYFPHGLEGWIRLGDEQHRYLRVKVSLLKAYFGSVSRIIKSYR